MLANVSASRAGDIAVIVEPYRCRPRWPQVIRPNGLRLFRSDQRRLYLSAAASLIYPVNAARAVPDWTRRCPCRPPPFGFILGRGHGREFDVEAVMNSGEVA
ncbi:hypothetical protein GCM10018954_070410 [Kutzneria kofuensis]